MARSISKYKILVTAIIGNEIPPFITANTIMDEYSVCRKSATEFIHRLMGDGLAEAVEKDEVPGKYLVKETDEGKKITYIKYFRITK